MFTEIIDALAEGGRVELRGFGTLDVREAGTKRNPKTGETVELGERRHV